MPADQTTCTRKNAWRCGGAHGTRRCASRPRAAARAQSGSPTCSRETGSSTARSRSWSRPASADGTGGKPAGESYGGQPDPELNGSLQEAGIPLQAFTCPRRCTSPISSHGCGNVLTAKGRARAQRRPEPCVLRGTQLRRRPGRRADQPDPIDEEKYGKPKAGAPQIAVLDTGYDMQIQTLRTAALTAGRLPDRPRLGDHPRRQSSRRRAGTARSLAASSCEWRRRRASASSRCSARPGYRRRPAGRGDPGRTRR